MDELKKGSKGYSKIRKRPNFGSLDMVDAMGYLHAIEKSSRGAVVAVFIYDDEVSVMPSQIGLDFVPLFLVD